MHAKVLTYKNKTNTQLLVKLNAILLLAAVALSLIYVVFINSNILKAYAMRDAEKRLATLKSVNEKMELDLAELRSMDHLKAAAFELGLVSADKIEYIKADTGVAMNR